MEKMLFSQQNKNKLFTRRTTLQLQPKPGTQKNMQLTRAHLKYKQNTAQIAAFANFA
jgi:hypothetical protein